MLGHVHEQVEERSKLRSEASAAHMKESCCKGRSWHIGGSSLGNNLGLLLRKFLGPVEVELLPSKITCNKPILECKQTKCVLLSNLLSFFQCTNNKIICCLCISKQSLNTREMRFRYKKNSIEILLVSCAD